MKDLDLLGPDADGSHLTLADADGRRYRLPVSDALRAAVRGGGRAMRAPARSGGATGTMSPREIQAQLRAGASIEEVAQRAGADPSRVESYAAPVEAERAYIAQRARDLRVGHLPDAPDLGDLVVDRLAAREVPADEIAWNAVRQEGHPWEVVVTFPVAGTTREARWRVDLQRHVLTALDDESRWLSETDLGTSPRRPFPGPGRANAPADALLDQLAASRGTRHEVVSTEEAFSEEEAMSPVEWHEAPGAHPAESHPLEAPDAAVLSLTDRQARARAAARRFHPSAERTEARPEDESGASEEAAVRHDDAERMPGGAVDATAGSPSGAPPAPTPEPAFAADEAAAETDEPDVPEAPRARPRRKGNRRSVPSWDEIVFGTRAD